MNIGIIILYSGERLLQKCLDSVKDQCKNIIIVSNINPYHDAINECYRLGVKNFDWFMVLDSDIVLYPNAIETYRKNIQNDLWGVVGRLEDYYHEKGRTGAIMFNSSAIGDTRHSNKPCSDREIHQVLADKGYKKILLDDYIGVHHPEWTCEEAFNRGLMIGRRNGQCPGCTNHGVNRAMRLGYEIGIKQIDQKLDIKDRDDWNKVKDKFNNKEILIWKKKKRNLI